MYTIDPERRKYFMAHAKFTLSVDGVYSLNGVPVIGDGVLQALADQAFVNFINSHVTETQHKVLYMPATPSLSARPISDFVEVGKTFSVTPAIEAMLMEVR